MDLQREDIMKRVRTAGSSKGHVAGRSFGQPQSSRSRVRVAV